MARAVARVFHTVFRDLRPTRPVTALPAAVAGLMAVAAAAGPVEGPAAREAVGVLVGLEAQEAGTSDREGNIERSASKKGAAGQPGREGWIRMGPVTGRRGRPFLP